MPSDDLDAAPRLATPGDAGLLAQLLHDFNTEFDVPTPGPAVLERRLSTLLSGDTTVALLIGSPPAGLALVTLRPNVWNDGPVALLDELYVVPPQRNSGLGSALIASLIDVLRDRGVELVEINVDEGDTDAQRFYERHRFTVVDPDTGERAIYYYRELSGD